VWSVARKLDSFHKINIGNGEALSVDDDKNGGCGDDDSSCKCWLAQSWLSLRYIALHGSRVSQNDCRMWNNASFISWTRGECRGTFNLLPLPTQSQTNIFLNVDILKKWHFQLWLVKRCKIGSWHSDLQVPSAKWHTKLKNYASTYAVPETPDYLPRLFLYELRRVFTKECSMRKSCMNIQEQTGLALIFVVRHKFRNWLHMIFVHINDLYIILCGSFIHNHITVNILNRPNPVVVWH
jgi:hypothetical protein